MQKKKIEENWHFPIFGEFWHTCLPPRAGVYSGGLGVCPPLSLLSLLPSSPFPPGVVGSGWAWSWGLWSWWLRSLGLGAWVLESFLIFSIYIFFFCFSYLFGYNSICLFLCLFYSFVCSCICLFVCFLFNFNFEFLCSFVLLFIFYRTDTDSNR